MKIGLVRRGYSASGGAERFLIRFAEGLRALGHQAVLFTDCGWPDSAWDSSKLQSVLLSPSGRTLSPLDFADALESAKPKEHCDFIFSFERVWNCDAFRAGDGVHRAWLDRRAHFEPAFKSWFRKHQKKHRQLLELEASLYSPQSSVRIVANSQMVKGEITKYYGLPAERITVIANGYDRQQIPAAERLRLGQEKRQQLGLADDEQVILFAGSGWKRKGLSFAMQAFEKLRKGKKARLIVAGKGKKPRGISQHDVLFLGEVNSLSPIYEAADTFILPTLYDPFSNACLEAAAHGLPVITTTANGFSDIVKHSEQGVIVEPGDVKAMASALKGVTNPLAEEARKQICSWAAEYSVALNVQTSLEFIDSCAKS